jgi:hypothetical protein
MQDKGSWAELKSSVMSGICARESGVATMTSRLAKEGDGNRGAPFPSIGDVVSVLLNREVYLLV